MTKKKQKSIQVGITVHQPSTPEFETARSMAGCAHSEHPRYTHILKRQFYGFIHDTSASITHYISTDLAKLKRHSHSPTKKLRTSSLPISNVQIFQQRLWLLKVSDVTSTLIKEVRRHGKGSHQRTWHRHHSNEKGHRIAEGKHEIATDADDSDIWWKIAEQWKRKHWLGSWGTQSDQPHSRTVYRLTRSHIRRTTYWYHWIECPVRIRNFLWHEGFVVTRFHPCWWPAIAIFVVIPPSSPWWRPAEIVVHCS